MTKGEIIASVLETLRHRSVEAEYLRFCINVDEEEAISYLNKVLFNEEPHTDIRTCRDFSNLNVKCCDACHIFDPVFELSLVDLPSGGNAWLCCAMNAALVPKDATERTEIKGHNPFAAFFSEQGKIE